jgi:hypothetical protein
LATEKDIDAPLTLELGGDDITPELFVRGIRSFFAVLNEFTDQIDDTVGWRVQVKEGSNLVGVWPRGLPSASVGKIVSSVEAGLAAIENDTLDTMIFPDKALQSARDLAKLSVASDGDLIVKVWTEKRPHPLSARTVALIDDVIGGVVEEHGSVAGRIQTISERGGAKFVIYDALTDDPISCVVPPEKLQDALRAFGHRAEIYGMVKYQKDGRARRIKVEDIVVFPEDDVLPKVASVRGIFAEGQK